MIPQYEIGVNGITKPAIPHTYINIQCPRTHQPVQIKIRADTQEYVRCCFYHPTECELCIFLPQNRSQPPKTLSEEIKTATKNIPQWRKK